MRLPTRTSLAVTPGHYLFAWPAAHAARAEAALQASPAAWPYVLPSKVLPPACTAHRPPCLPGCAACQPAGPPACWLGRFPPSPGRVGPTLPATFQPPPACSQVTRGDLMPVAAGGRVRLARILAVERVVDTGVFMPHTWSGRSPPWHPCVVPVHGARRMERARRSRCMRDAAGGELPRAGLRGAPYRRRCVWTAC